MAVFEKVSDLPTDLTKDHREELKAALAAKTTTRNNEGKPFGHKNKRRRFHGYKEDPYVFLFKQDSDWLEIKKFYGMTDQFDSSCLLTRRKSERKRNIYFASELMKDLLLQNEHRIKIVNMGLKIFVRCQNALSENSFRLTQEAVYTTVRFMDGERHINVTRQDLITLMKCRDPTKPPIYSTLEKATEEACLKIGKRELSLSPLSFNVFAAICNQIFQELEAASSSIGTNVSFSMWWVGGEVLV